MKRIFSFLLCLLLPAALTAQVAKSRPQLYVEIDTNLASGQSISAAQLRETLKNVVASSEVPLTDGPDQPVDADLVALAALNTFGVAERTAANTWSTNTWAQVWQKLLADPQAGTYTYTALPFGITNDKRLLGRDSALPPATAMEIAIGPGLQLSSGTLGFDPAASMTFASINGTPIGNVTPSTGAFTAVIADSLTTASFIATSINNTPIGNITPSTGNFSSLTATTFSSAITAGSINNTPIGNSTPSTGAFSALTVKATSPSIEFRPTAYEPQYTTSLGVRNSAEGVLILGNNGPNEIRAGRSATGGHLVFYTNNTVDQNSPSDGSVSMILTPTGINNTPIGATTPSNGVFTRASVNDGTVDATFFPTGGVAILGTTSGHDVSLYRGGVSVGLITDSGLNNIAIGTATPSTGKFTTLTTTGTISSTGTGSVFQAISGTTQQMSMRFANTGGDYYFGAEDSMGGTFGGTAYAAILYAPSEFDIILSGSKRGVFTTTGLNSTAIGTTTPSTGRFTNALVGSAAVPDNMAARTLGIALNPAGHLNARLHDQWAIGTDLTAGVIMEFFSDNGTTEVYAGGISVSGATTTYGTASDRRLKKNIRDFKLSGAIIDRLHPKIYDWKSGDKDAIGIIAQELYEVFPSAVVKGDESTKKIEQPWMVDYSKLVPVLVAEIQDLRARVAQLEKKKP